MMNKNHQKLPQHQKRANGDIIEALTLSVTLRKVFLFQTRKGGLVSESSFSLLEVSTTEPPF